LQSARRTVCGATTYLNRCGPWRSCLDRSKHRYSRQPCAWPDGYPLTHERIAGDKMRLVRRIPTTEQPEGSDHYLLFFFLIAPSGSAERSLPPPESIVGAPQDQCFIKRDYMRRCLANGFFEQRCFTAFSHHLPKITRGSLLSNGELDFAIDN
jgi:hypothetical protein